MLVCCLKFPNFDRLNYRKFRANIRRSREQNKFICSAEAQQYMWQSGQIYAEAESNANKKPSGSRLEEAKSP